MIEERYEVAEQKAKPTILATTTDAPSSLPPVASIPEPKVKRPLDDFGNGDDESTPKPKKKVKKEAAVDSDDAAYAARLQAEENSLARPTRGGATRKRAPLKKVAGSPSKTKKKSSTKIKASDDSDVGTGEEGETKKSGAFHKPYALSQPLADLVGESQVCPSLILPNHCL